YFQWFLDDDMLPRLRGGNGRLHVGATRRGDDDDVDIAASQDGGQVGVNVAFQTEFVGHLAGVIRPPADEGDELSARYIGESASVEAGDHADTDDGEIGHGNLSIV